jgi:tetratricopeptide (TPR) repeat protein
MYHHLGQILGQQRKFKESVAALQKANELDPTNAEVLFEIATTYEEYNSNKTLALNYYRIYLKEAGESGNNVNYALTRITKLKEDLFFEE